MQSTNINDRWSGRWNMICSFLLSEWDEMGKNCVIDAKPLSKRRGGLSHQVHIHSSVDSEWNCESESECQWNPGLILKQVNFRCKCVDDCVWKGERKTERRQDSKHVYINSQQLPLQKKKIIYCMDVKRMLDNESWNALLSAFPSDLNFHLRNFYITLFSVLNSLLWSQLEARKTFFFLHRY